MLDKFSVVLSTCVLTISGLILVRGLVRAIRNRSIRRMQVQNTYDRLVATGRFEDAAFVAKILDEIEDNVVITLLGGYQLEIMTRAAKVGPAKRKWRVSIEKDCKEFSSEPDL